MQSLTENHETNSSDLDIQQFFLLQAKVSDQGNQALVCLYLNLPQSLTLLTNRQKEEAQKILNIPKSELLEEVNENIDYLGEIIGCKKLSKDNTCLLEAAKKGKILLLEVALNKDARNSFDVYGISTPLYVACYFGHKTIVDYLLDNGCEINFRNESKRTPLHFACIIEDRDIVQLLLSKGADYNAKSDGGYTPLDLAKHSKKRRDILVPVTKQSNHNEIVSLIESFIKTGQID